MKHVHQTLTALLAITILATTTASQTTDSASAYWTFGARINQGQLFGLLGVTKRLSSRIHQYTGADLGGIERSLTTQTAIRITKQGRWEVHGLIGPQIETIETNPTTELTVDYVTASTGALLIYQHNYTLSGFIGFQYLWTGADIKHWKFGLGLLLPIDLSR